MNRPAGIIGIVQPPRDPIHPTQTDYLGPDPYYAALHPFSPVANGSWVQPIPTYLGWPVSQQGASCALQCDSAMYPVDHWVSNTPPPAQVSVTVGFPAMTVQQANVTALGGLAVNVGMGAAYAPNGTYLTWPSVPLNVAADATTRIYVVPGFAGIGMVHQNTAQHFPDNCIPLAVVVAVGHTVVSITNQGLGPAEMLPARIIPNAEKALIPTFLSPYDYVPNIWGGPFRYVITDWRNVYNASGLLQLTINGTAAGAGSPTRLNGIFILVGTQYGAMGQWGEGHDACYWTKCRLGSYTYPWPFFRSIDLTHNNVGHWQVGVWGSTADSHTLNVDVAPNVSLAGTYHKTDGGDDLTFTLSKVNAYEWND